MSDKDRLNSVLRKVAGKLQLQNYQYRYRCLDKAIENYFGELIPVTLTGETKDGILDIELIVKLSPNNKELRDAGVLEYLFDAEIFVYTVLISHYKKLSKFHLSEIFPECYYSDTTQYNEVLVLKDMCCEGFRRYQGDRFLDPDHVVVSLKSLAQFHALSLIFQNYTNNIEDRISMRPYCAKHPFQLMVAIRNSIKNNFSIFTDTKHSAFFSMLDIDFDDIVNNSTVKTKRLVYGHGDFWKENILYKYEDNKPVGACILDYQTTRLLCPAQDVLCFLLTSTDAKVRRKRHEYFLSTYYNCLQQTLLDHGLIPESIYSKKDFDNDLKIVAPYCFITTNMSFSLWLGLEDKALVKSKNIYEDEVKKNTAILYYKQIILDIAEDFITFGYYTPLCVP